MNVQRGTLAEQTKGGRKSFSMDGVNNRDFSNDLLSCSCKCILKGSKGVILFVEPAQICGSCNPKVIL